jgi:hypothetical protein
VSGLFDAVIIPGGGVRPDGKLPPWAAARFDRAVERQPGGPFIALSAGTPHLANPLDPTGRPVFEAYAGVRYLLELGVPSDCIFTEISSYDTIGNAYFARVQHTDVRGWRRLLIVNNAFHMPRTEAIFRFVFGLRPDGGYELEFDTTPDTGMPDEIRIPRMEREAASLESLPQRMTGIGSLADLHAWLYRDHAAYRAESAIASRAPDPSLARLY